MITGRESGTTTHISLPAPAQPAAPAPIRHVLSLGAGVQSSTIALMAAHGQITPMPDCAIFADTHHEPAKVYEWLKFLKPRLPFPVYTVSRGDLWKAATTVRKTKDGERSYISTGIPIFFAGSEGGELTTRRGIGKRQCTRDFKTDVITREVKRIVGLKRAKPSTPVLATTWIGISADESHRAKPSRERWIAKRYPLLEMDMDRMDCLEWMAGMSYPVPPRSACIFCPFHDDDSWLALSPEELFKVAAMEVQMQTAYAKASAIKGIPYFHDSRKPILQVKFEPTTSSHSHQRRLFGAECEGMCGV